MVSMPRNLRVFRTSRSSIMHSFLLFAFSIPSRHTSNTLYYLESPKIILISSEICTNIIPYDPKQMSQIVLDPIIIPYTKAFLSWGGSLPKTTAGLIEPPWNFQLYIWPGRCITPDFPTTCIVVSHCFVAFRKQVAIFWCIFFPMLVAVIFLLLLCACSISIRSITRCSLHPQDFVLLPFCC